MDSLVCPRYNGYQTLLAFMNNSLSILTRYVAEPMLFLLLLRVIYIIGPYELTKFAVFSTFIYIFEAQKAFIVFFLKYSTRQKTY